MKEYEVTKTVVLKFIIKAESPQEAEWLAWNVDDAKAFHCDVYDIEVEDEEE